MPGWNVHDNLPVLLLGRMALVALVIGTSVSVSSTERIDVSLLLSGWIAWSFVPVLQLLTGAVLVRGAAMPRTRALGEYFGTHWPWSLWIIGMHAAILLIVPARDLSLWLAITAAVPAVATIRLLIDFCRGRLGMSRRLAIRRVATHQALTVALILSYANFAVALWPRVAG
jgi:hypothetical protein